MTMVKLDEPEGRKRAAAQYHMSSTRVHFQQFYPPDGWAPAVNAYRCEHSILVCVDLAGVEKNQIDLSIQPGKMTIRGVRQAPEPHEGQQAVRVLCIEIEHGPFERELTLPSDVDVEQVTAEQNNGMLWITLPLQNEA